MASRPTITDKLDVVFAFDTTGSMYRFLTTVKAQLDYLYSEIYAAIPDVQIGAIAYGDYCDAATDYVTQVLPFTKHKPQFHQFIHQIRKTDGGDFPEAVEEALHAANQLPWRLGSRRALILIGDAPPHGVIDSPRTCLYNHFWQQEILQCSKKKIRVHTVQCGHHPDTQRIFQTIARRTQGIYISLAHIHHLVPLLVGICLQEVHRLAEYRQKLQHQPCLTPDKDKLLAQLRQLPLI